ncbi:hypothetical protein Peur_031636 [Populus x canadensis]
MVVQCRSLTCCFRCNVYIITGHQTPKHGCGKTDVFAGPRLGIHLGYYLPGLKGVVELNLNLAHLGCHFTSCFSYKTLVYSLNSTLGFLICNTAWRSKNPILFIA